MSVESLLEQERFDRQFLADEVDGENIESKQVIRQMILDFFVANHAADAVRLLSLPGAFWRFESMMQDRFGKGSRFIGVEREIGIIRRGIPWMPGEQPRWFEHPHEGFVTRGVRTAFCQMIHAELSDFTTVGRSVLGSKSDRINYKRSFCNWSCVWLDFTSQLCRDVELILPRIGNGCDLEIPCIPVAITILKARETPDINRKLAALGTDRAGYVTALLSSNRYREFLPLATRDYISRQSPMLTVMGLLKLRPR